MKLKDYLEEAGIPITKFAKRLGVTSNTIHNLIKGSDVRLSIGVKIQRITKGKVSCEDLYRELIEPQEKQSKNKKDNS